MGASKTFPQRVLSVDGRDTLVIDRAPRGALVIKNLELFDDRHDALVTFHNDKMWIKDDVRFERPDEKTLQVFDHNNDEVLELVLWNKSLLIINGRLSTRSGFPVVLRPDGTLIQGSEISGDCAFNGPNDFVFGSGAGGSSQ